MVHRVGLIVPSSNVTVESEVPALLGLHRSARFSFHSSRMRMHEVSPEQLAAMNAQRERCVLEVADASPDVILYACLVAVMVGGLGAHRRVESALSEQLAVGGSTARVRSSAGALLEALTDLKARRIAMVMPYMRPLAKTVVDYVEAEGFTVADWRALEVSDNREVGCIPSDRVMDAARSMDLSSIDALVISACVQMPSLAVIPEAEAEFGVPVLSAATAGVYSLLRTLDLPVAIPHGGTLLTVDDAVSATQERNR